MEGSKDPSRTGTQKPTNPDAVYQWIAIRTYSAEKKPGDLAPAVRKWKYVQDAHGHDDQNMLCIAIWTTRAESQKLKDKLPVDAETISPAKVTVQFTAEKGADAARLAAELQVVAGAQHAELKGTTGELYINLLGFNLESVRRTAKECGYKATVTSHEIVRITVGEMDQRFPKLQQALAAQEGVITIRGEIYQKKLTLVAPAGKITEKIIRTHAEGAGCTVARVEYDR